MSQLITIPLEVLDSNPYRDLTTYPFVELKVNALKRSIKTVGLWEGVIARKVGDRYQTAFGHHRIEAARRSGLTEAIIILRDLDDKAMLQFMGRENMADYNADFLTMLQTWDAAVQHMASRDATSIQPIELADLLGWTTDRTRGGIQMNRTADACNATYKLLQDGFLKREDLVDLTVNEAREICVRAQADVDRIVKKAKKTKEAATEITAAKKHIAKAVIQTAKESRRGQIKKTDLRSRVGINAYRYDRKSKKKSPLFGQFGKELSNGINKMLNEDATAIKLNEVKNALGDITLKVDKVTVARIQWELNELASRATKLATAMIVPKATPKLKEISSE
jgi:ParB-like chromosome segregation protein Spo0J